jgi:hypothetical protein
MRKLIESTIGSLDGIVESPSTRRHAPGLTDVHRFADGPVILAYVARYR